MRELCEGSVVDERFRCSGGSRRELTDVEELVDIVGYRPGEPDLRVHIQGPALIIPLPPEADE